MYDLIIRQAQVFDGLGNPGRNADVAVKDGVVAKVGVVEGSAKRVVEAKGLALMPGIVDLHTHFDAQVTWDPTLSPSPGLGVTTVVMGNCGFGITPCPAEHRETMMKNLSVVEGMDLNALMNGINWNFESFKEYMDRATVRLALPPRSRRTTAATVVVRCRRRLRLKKSYWR